MENNIKDNRKIILTVIVVLVLAVFLVYKNNVSFFQSKPELILKTNVNLSKTDIEFIEKRLVENQEKLVELGEKATLMDKVNLNFVISADYRLLGEYGKAKEVLEQTMTLDPLNSNIISTYSSLLAAMGDKKGSLDYINKAISLYPLEQNYWRWKIDLEKDLGKKGIELEKIYKDALIKTNKDLNIVTYYAVFLEGEKRYSDAIIQWKEAIKIEPSLKVNYQAEIDRLQAL